MPFLPARSRHARARTTVLAAALSLGAATAVAVSILPASPASADERDVAVAGASGLSDLADDALGTLDRARVSGRPSLFRKYLMSRNQVATRTAKALQLDPEEVRSAWSSADLRHQTAVLAAITQLGVPYRTNASQEGVGFDCSGLTGYAWGRAGVGIEHQSARQLNAAAPRDRDSAQPGDLIEYPGHVMMYLGVGDAIIHSPYTGKTVEFSTISSGRSVRFGDPSG